MRDDDRDRVLARLVQLAPRLERVGVLVCDGDPVAKQRSRSTKHGGHYTPKETVRAERDLGFLMKALPRPYVGNVAIVALFYLATRRPKDGENMLKLVMDAGTKAHLWHDDSQVTAGLFLVELDRAHPRTVIALCDTTSTLDRTVPAKRRDRELLQ